MPDDHADIGGLGQNVIKDAHHIARPFGTEQPLDGRLLREDGRDDHDREGDHDGDGAAVPQHADQHDHRQQHGENEDREQAGEQESGAPDARS